MHAQNKVMFPQLHVEPNMAVLEEKERKGETAKRKKERNI